MQIDVAWRDERPQITGDRLQLILDDEVMLVRAARGDKSHHFIVQGRGRNQVEQIFQHARDRGLENRRPDNITIRGRHDIDDGPRIPVYADGSLPSQN